MPNCNYSKRACTLCIFETLTDPKIARLLAQETGAETAVLDPLEGLDDEGRAACLDYLSIMERNVHNLEKALQE